MRNALLVAALTACTMAAPAAAQMDHGMDGEMDHDAMHAAGSLAPVAGLYHTVRDYLLATAEQASPQLYEYRPSEEVRSFGEILGHVANAGYSFCSSAAAMEAPQRGNAEELGSKTEIVEALRASFAFCDEAYEMDGDMVGESLTFFGQEHTRLSVLAFNMGHDYEHYGNLVTYMRLNGVVPPSSQGM